MVRDAAAMSDGEIQRFLEQHGEADLGDVTVSRGPEFVFVNFGFQAT